MWVPPDLRTPAITNLAVYWMSNNETKTLTSNNVIHLLQGSLQHVAGIWRHGNKLSYKAALVDCHWLEEIRELAAEKRESQGSSKERQSAADYSPFLSHLDAFTAKLEQLSWHLTDFQVNNHLIVAFGFKLPYHFVFVFHIWPEVIFNIVGFFVSIGVCCFLV